MPILQYDRQARTLGPGVLTIGSAPEAGWRIQDQELAPVHALVTLERDGHARLTRPNALARILVNGEELWDASRPLAIGDEIMLGDARFTLVNQATHKAGSDVAYLRDLSRGRAWKLGQKLSIGRDVACEVHIPDPDVSRVHAEIERAGEQVMIRPTGGLVFRNGVHLTAAATLEEGDELAVGRTTLRFTRETPVSAAVVTPDPERRPNAGAMRMSKAQTSYMGVVQMREQLTRDRNRKYGRVARVVLMVAAVALAGTMLLKGSPRVSLRTSGQSAGEVAR